MSSQQLLEFFTTRSNLIVDSECFKLLNHLLGESSKTDLDHFFKECHPIEHHLQLLKAKASRSTCHFPTLIAGCENEIRDISRYYIQSKCLYQNSNSPLLNLDTLIPLLKRVSYLTRNRIIWNLGKYRRHADLPEDQQLLSGELCDGISEVFGKSSAMPMVCACTEDKILEYISQQCFYETALMSGDQLLAIWNKCPKIRTDKEKEITFGRRVTDTAIEKYINAQRFPIMLEQLHSTSARALSHRAWKKMFRDSFELTLRHCSKLTHLAEGLENLPLRKLCTKNQWARLVTKRAKIMSFRRNDISELYILTSCNSSQDFYNAILDGYKMAFPNCNSIEDLFIEDAFGYLDEIVLALLPTDVRNELAESLMKKKKNDHWKFIQCLPTHQSVPMLQKLCHRSIENRDLYHRAMLKSCIINKDAETLLTVLPKCIPHLPSSDYSSEMPAQRNIKPIIQSLSDEQFKFLAEIVFNNSDKLADVFVEHVVERWIETATTNEDLDLYFKVKRRIHDLSKLSPHLREYYITVIDADYEGKGNLNKLSKLLTTWNRQAKSIGSHPFQISRFSNICNALIKENRFSYGKNDVAIPFLSNPVNGCSSEMLANVYKSLPRPRFWEKVFSSCEFSENDLEQICQKIASTCAEYEFLSPNRVYRGLLSHMRRKTLKYDIRQQLAKEIQRYITGDLKSQLSRQHIRILALCVSPEDFFNIMKCDLPPLVTSESQVDDKRTREGSHLSDGHEDDNEDTSRHGSDDSGRPRIDSFGHRNRGLARVECDRDIRYLGIAMAFRDIEPPYLCLDYLDRYCVSGSLMLFVRDPFHSITCRLNVEKAMSFLSGLVGRVVSVKKHAIRAIGRILDANAQVQMFLNLLQTETHPTARAIMAKIALDNVFPKSRWDIIKELLMTLRDVDYDTANLFDRNVEIPRERANEFCDIVMERLHQQPRGDRFVRFHRWIKDQFIKNASLCRAVWVVELLENSFFAEDCSSVPLELEDYEIYKILIDFIKSTYPYESTDSEMEDEEVLKLCHIVSQSEGIKCLCRLLEKRVTSEMLSNSDGKSISIGQRYIKFVEDICSKWVEPSNNQYDSIVLEQIVIYINNHLRGLPQSLMLTARWAIEFSTLDVDINKKKRSNFDRGIELGRKINSIVEEDPMIARFCLLIFLKDFMTHYGWHKDNDRSEIIEGIMSFFDPISAAKMKLLMNLNESDKEASSSDDNESDCRQIRSCDEMVPNTHDRYKNEQSNTDKSCFDGGISGQYLFHLKNEILWTTIISIMGFPHSRCKEYDEAQLKNFVYASTINLTIGLEL